MQNENCVREWATALSRSRERLEKDPAERLRMVALTKAADKINRMVLTDLLRLKLMGVAPAKENAVIDYHP